VVSNLVPARNDPFCGLRKTLDMATDQEEGRANVVFGKKIENVRRFRAWPIIKRQRNRM
jgi:hypothetical protein